MPKTVDAKKKVIGFLEEKEISFQIKEEDIVIPYEIDGIKFQPIIQFHGNKWIVISSLIMKKNQIPADKYGKILEELLIANHELPEINYDISREGDIYTSVDMKADIIDFDNFFSEFYAIPFGIKNFIEKIAPKYDLKTMK